VAKTVPFSRREKVPEDGMRQAVSPAGRVNSPEEGLVGFLGSWPEAEKVLTPETAMSKHITLTVDYHDRACVVRWFDHSTGCDQVFSEVPTTKGELDAMVEKARAAAGRKGSVTWIQESTTGWARVQSLVADRAAFHLANVLQMPLPPIARRRKTDKIDTARMQREYLNGSLPLAYQPPASSRQLRRLVGYREDLVNRRTGVRNWINRFLAHETWFDRTGLWSSKGQKRLLAHLENLPHIDALVVGQKLDELARLEDQLGVVLTELVSAYSNCPAAQRLDAIGGIDVVAAISIVARIGSVERFRNADHLIAFAGLAPGIQESDQTRRNGRIGGGGTDLHLRHYLIEATTWARRIPRYRPAYERMARRRGSKVARVVVARMMLRSIYKMLKHGVAFDANAPLAVASIA
jgi:transposase